MHRERGQLEQEVDRLKINTVDRPGGRTFDLGVQWNEDRTAVDFFYRAGQLICDQANEDIVRSAFDALSLEPPRSAEQGPAGVVIFDIGERNAADLAKQLSDHIGADDVVTPNHVLDSQGHWAICPASEPIPWTSSITQLREPVGPGIARVAVVDTGYSIEAARDSSYGRLLAVEKDSELDDEVFFQDGTIRPYGGHGTATTAQLLAMSGIDNVTAKVRDCLVGGAVDEITIVDDLVKVIEAGVDVISIQAGLYTRLGHSPLAFKAFRRRVLSKYPDVVIVAAAGNNGSDQPFWPAAYDWVTAVGALTKGGDARTGWTNFGHWVDVYASGENITVPFPNGTYKYLSEFSAEFTEGHALWSGTSFAAPVVAGMIARRMIERNVSAPEARKIVLAEAAIAALPTTGPRVIV